MSIQCQADSPDYIRVGVDICQPFLVLFMYLTEWTLSMIFANLTFCGQFWSFIEGFVFDLLEIMIYISILMYLH